MTVTLEIKEKSFKIKLSKNLNELDRGDVFTLYSLIKTFRNLEKEKGNEVVTGTIKIKYIANFEINENINIFKLIRTPVLDEYLEYFEKFGEKFGEQSHETKLNLNDYRYSVQNISQNIDIAMFFKIKTKKRKIEENAKILIRQLEL